MTDSDLQRRPPGAPGGRRPIRPLREEVARKIAAGEIIERPASVLRELLDNSLDAGSSEITVAIEEGGLASIEVSDDGEGIPAADLEHCALPHSTSKIVEEADLYRIASLGFRGEALASIAACARLSLTTRTVEESSAHRLVVEGGARRAVEPCAARPGTAVSVRDLFFNMPARRRFLKSPSAESALCRSVFDEKALAFPNVSFRLLVGGELKAFYPASALRERALAVLGRSLDAPLLEETAASGEGFSMRLLLAPVALARRDRRLIQIFVNRRRIQEFSLVQAVEYGYTGYLPGGLHPVALLFAEVSADLVDFNVHPTKREARIRILPELHRAAASATRRAIGRPSGAAATVQPAASAPPWPHGEQGSLGFPGGGPSPREQAALAETIAERVTAYAARGAQEATRATEPPAPAEPGPRYLGQIFGVFLLVEWRQTLYVIDQHAAHERLLMDELLARPKTAQELLLPISFEATEGEAAVLRERAAVLERLGIRVEATGGGGFEVTAMPHEFASVEEGELVRFLKDFERPPEILEREIHALAACRAAIKDGDPVDPATAVALAEAVLSLAEPRCPHGRPIWFAVSCDELLRRVGRIL